MKLAQSLKSRTALVLLGGLLGAMPMATLAQSMDFTSTDAEEEGYWYSRYNLGNLAMRSGLGDVVAPQKDVMMKAMAAVDGDFDQAKMMAGTTDYGDGDHVVPPLNAAPIATVYKSGDPHYITKFNGTDFGTQRWDPAKMDKTLTGLANGFAILKEAEWARQFHVDDHFGTPTSDFGAYWRFVGMIMTMNAKMQAGSFLKNMDAYDLSNGGDAVMLIALADLADLLSADQLAHSGVANRYQDPHMAQMVDTATFTLFKMVEAGHPADVRGQSLAIQSLVWYGAKTASPDHKARAMHKLAALAADLQAASPATAAEQAYALRGLIEAHRTLGIDDGTIRHLGTQFIEGFDLDTGGFTNQSLYTIDDIGAIFGALNTLRTFETADVDADVVNEVFTSLWENAVNIGGLQISAPPLKAVKSPFEYEGEPVTFFRYNDSQPVPPMAGGDYGVAPVFATSIEYGDGAWSVVDATFDAAGAMHASNEMIWFHYDEINGFPVVDLSDVLR